MSNTNSNNLSGRRQNNREQKPLYITVSRIKALSEIRIDPVLGKILVDSGNKIQVEIDGSNNVSVIFVNRKGDQVGSVKDIERIAGFRKFANDEKKASVAESIMAPIEAKMTRAVELQRTETGDAGYTPPKLAPAMLEALKDSNKRVQMLLENRRILETARGNKPAEQQGVVEALVRWINQCLEVHAAYVRRIVAGGEIKGFLSESLFVNRVPSWVHQRLTSSNLATMTGGDVRRFLFPADARKGVSVTVRELANPAFRAANAWLLQYSNLQIAVISNGALIRAIANSQADISFENEADVVGTSLRNEKVVVTPHWFGVEYLFEPKSRGKGSSFTQNPDFSTPKAGLRSIMETLVAVQTFDIRTSDQVSSIWGPIAAGLDIDFRTNVNARRNLFRVALDAETQISGRIKALFAVANQQAEILFRALVQIGLRMTPTSVIYGALMGGIDFQTREDTTTELWTENLRTSAVRIDGLDLDAENPRVQAATSAMHDTLHRPIVTGGENDLRTRVVEASGTRALRGGKKKSQNVNLSSLSKEARTVAKKFTDDLAFLKKPLEEWLRGFATESMQIAAARLVEAQMDSLLNDREDEESDAESDSDDDE